jgi:predicted signal transduction protein with EAL and GGDEF domain
MANTRRLGALLFGLVGLLLAVLCVFSPPNAAIGGGGWAIAALIVGSTTAFVAMLVRGRPGVNWNGLLIASYVIAAGIGVMQWLAGGTGESYDMVLLLPIVLVAAIHPPRRIALFMAFVLVILAAPFVYDGWDSTAVGSATARYLMWWALTLLTSLMMIGVRTQRLAHAEDEAEAREEARVDSLTSLHNRRAFDEMLELEIKRARRLGLPLCMGMVDIENFKEINDRWSYVEGDRCLR